MKLHRNREISLGLLIGFTSPIVFLPIVLLIMSISSGAGFEYFWSQLKNYSEFQSKYLSLAMISNLIWFYIFLNREKYEYTKGIIIGLLLYAPYMIYINIIK
jgi:ABC-type sulfate transport system permease component